MIQFFLLMLIGIFSSAFATFPSPNYPPDIARILQRGTIIIGISQDDAPPFFMRDKAGNLTGYDVSLAQDLAKNLGVKIVFNAKAKSFDELVKLVANGEIDVAVNVTPTLERAKQIIFSDPYFSLPLGLLVNRFDVASQGDNIQKLNNKQYHIGVLSGSAFVEFAKQDLPNATFVLYGNIEKALQDVKDHKLNAVFLDSFHIQHWLKNNPDANLYTQLFISPNTNYTIALAMAWQNEHLRHWINLYLISIKENGTEGRLRKTFFGE